MKIAIYLSLSLNILFCKGAGSTKLEKHFDRKIQPFAFVLPEIKPVQGVGGRGMRAQDCGACHQAIYKEWQQSTHAAAMTDLQFLAEVAKVESPKWLCRNCHAPVQNQRRYKVVGLKNNNVLEPVTVKNKSYDPIMRKEGIGCASCHIRMVDGKSTIIGPFKTNLAPHPVVADKKRLHSVCKRCHDPKGEAVTRNLVCWFETFKENSEFQKNTKSKDSCVSCHMPPNTRKLAAAFVTPVRKTREHHWVGSGVPKTFSAYDSLLQRGYKPGLSVITKLVKKQLTIDLKNTTGHYLPTGDPERFILLEVTLNTAKRMSHLLLKEQIGQTWRWNPARKIGDNRLKANESRLFKQNISQPFTALTIKVFHGKLKTATIAHLKSATKVDSSTVINAIAKIKKIDSYYPMASLIFQQIIYNNGKQVTATAKQLIQLSKNLKDNKKDF